MAVNKKQLLWHLRCRLNDTVEGNYPQAYTVFSLPNTFTFTFTQNTREVTVNKTKEEIEEYLEVFDEIASVDKSSSWLRIIGIEDNKIYTQNLALASATSVRGIRKDIVEECDELSIYLNTAIKYTLQILRPFNYIETFSTEKDKQEYTLTNVEDVASVYSGNDEVRHINEIGIGLINPSSLSSSSTPSFYTMSGHKKIKLYPIPDDEYSITVVGYKYNDDDNIIAGFENLVLLYAEYLSRTARPLNSFNINIATQCKELYTALLNALQVGRKSKV